MDEAEARVGAVPEVRTVPPAERRNSSHVSSSASAMLLEEVEEAWPRSAMVLVGGNLGFDG